ncbi:hypothetical protein [Ilumatobacter sp.]|uniref:hypothetical protein n=1 Tax=Ilumatobacter sp. TaxID=1967498 RepID=UPI003C325612
MIIVSNRHNGPPHSAHGGVAAGQMAALVDAECAVVRFHAPPPLEKALVGIARVLGAVEILVGSQHVATVRPSPACRTHAAVVDEAGRHVAVAGATWIAVPSASIAAS